MRYLTLFAFLFIASTLAGNRAYGNGITIVSSSLEISGAWSEPYYSFVDEQNHNAGGNFGATSTGGTPISASFIPPSQQGTKSGSQGGASGTLSSFDLNLSADAAPHYTFLGSDGPGPFGSTGVVLGAQSQITADATTHFHPTGTQLTVDLDGYSIPDTYEWGHFTWQLTITDLTSSSILLDCQTPFFGGDFIHDYNLDVDPLHLYSLELSGSAYVNGGDLFGDVHTSVQLDSTTQDDSSREIIPVPETSSTLGLVAGSLAGLVLFCRRYLTC